MTDVLGPGGALRAPGEPGGFPSALEGGPHALWMQADGNLVLVRKDPRRVLWSKHSSPGSQLWMQPDGNLVLMGIDPATQKPAQAAWSSGTSEAGSSLVLNAEGNLVIVNPAGKGVWTLGPAVGHAKTDTLLQGESLLAGDRLVSGNEYTTLTVQHDGNLVLEHLGTVRWANDVLAPDASLVMQKDGNLVARRAELVDGQPLAPIFASGTDGNPFARASVDDGGHLTVWSPTDAVLAVRPAAIQVTVRNGGTSNPGTGYIPAGAQSVLKHLQVTVDAQTVDVPADPKAQEVSATIEPLSNAAQVDVHIKVTNTMRGGRNPTFETSATATVGWSQRSQQLSWDLRYFGTPTHEFTMSLTRT